MSALPVMSVFMLLTGLYLPAISIIHAFYRALLACNEHYPCFLQVLPNGRVCAECHTADRFRFSNRMQKRAQGSSRPCLCLHCVLAQMVDTRDNKLIANLQEATALLVHKDRALGAQGDMPCRDEGGVRRPRLGYPLQGP